jgi:hypothetical protein
MWKPMHPNAHLDSELCHGLEHCCDDLRCCGCVALQHATDSHAQLRAALSSPHLKARNKQQPQMQASVTAADQKQYHSNTQALLITAGKENGDRNTVQLPQSMQNRMSVPVAVLQTSTC